VFYVYLDESGTGKIAAEPVTVVSGIILHADRDWAAARSKLGEVSELFAPGQAQLFFHAKEILNGGKRFPRDKWPEQVRHDLLYRLACIPKEMGLRVLYGQCNRVELMAERNASIKEATDTAYTVAILTCILQAEHFMRQNAQKEELATLVAEDGAGTKARVQRLFAHYNDPDYVQRMQLNVLRQVLPLTRFVDTVHFAQKERAPLLQMADVCAYSIRRRIAGEPYSDRFFAPLSEQLYHQPMKSSLTSLPSVRQPKARLS
jgi:hypothetical protein